MTKDNNLLGKFELSGIPPAPRGVPQIEIAFDVDQNGILEVSATDLGTKKIEKYKVERTGRLSEEEIARMVEEAKEFEEEDKKMKAKVDAKSGLESYLYSVRNTLDDPEKLGDSLSEDEIEKVRELIKEKLEWVKGEHETEEYEAELKEAQNAIGPIMSKIYNKAGSQDGSETDL